MNATINKIVSLLFEDLVETEETSAIREEVLQNCQERYQDLRDAGISEDDAIHAVIESLNGMEEMLSAYPRKDDEPVKAPEAPEIGEAEEEKDGCSWQFDPTRSPIHEIRMEHMANANVYVALSDDPQVHVEVACEKADLTLMAGLENGVLSIALNEQKTEDLQFSLEDGFDLSSLGRMFEKLAKRFANSWTEAEVTLSIPASLQPSLSVRTVSGSVSIERMTFEKLLIGTVSGDVELDCIEVRSELRATSASGDITIGNISARSLHLSSTSGDLEADHCSAGEDARLNTTSGDITWYSSCKTIEASSISGDMELEGMAETVSFKTVSGDVSVTLRSQQLRSVNGKTTSGDVEVYLPEGMQADVRCSTVSGDIYNHAGSIPGAPVTVTLSAVAGDIEVN